MHITAGMRRSIPILTFVFVLGMSSPLWAVPDFKPDKAGKSPKADRNEAGWLGKLQIDDRWTASSNSRGNGANGHGNANGHTARGTVPPVSGPTARPAVAGPTNSASPIPEPASALLLLVGSLIVGHALRRPE